MFTRTVRSRVQHRLTALVLVVAGVAGLAETGRHTVRAGETLSEIARANGTSTSALAAANGITNPNHIVVGDVLVIPGAAAPATSTHVVASGETLAAIARRYGTTVPALAAANAIANPNLVRIGQRLVVPAGGGPAPAPAPASTVHVVAAGQTLAGIAGRYGTTVSAIAAANGITNPNLVRVGQRLVVPAGGGSGGNPATTSAYAATGGASGRTGVAGTHLVAPGETVTGIARRYGIDPLDLAAANGLAPPTSLFAFARLFLDRPAAIPTDLARCPVPGATFVNDWGFPRSGGRAHQGNDLFAPRGTPVLAPVSGTVTTSVGTIGGRQFRLVAPDGTVYLGSHLDAFGATGRVAAGDVIGTVGSSGNAAGTRPHLHFEVHPGGHAAMNPFPLLRHVCT